MKSNFVVYTSIIAIILVCNITLYAQSDYEITQNFKNSHKTLSDSIHNAVDLAACNQLQQSINDFIREYSSHKSLLDKSLYPDNFDSSLAKLQNALDTRRIDFVQITDLQTTVEELRDEISLLNRKNSLLISEIQSLGKIKNKNKKTIDSLRTLVNDLSNSISKRDELVLSIVDSLISDYVNTPSSLNEAESRNFIKKVESKNMFFNVRRTVEDNIEFLKVTSLNYDDLEKMKNHQISFSNLWRQIGPTLAEVYLKRNERAVEIGQIDGLFRDWSKKIDEKIWTSVDQLFRSQEIAILKYKNGTEFTDNVISFIEDEIKNASVKGRDESENTFAVFTYSIWFKDMKPLWVPMLIENNMLTQTQKDTIESRIAKWQRVVAPPSYTWLYFIVGLIVIALILLFYKKDKKSKNNNVKEETAKE